MRIEKLLALGLILVLGLMTGCAAANYPGYVREQSKVSVEEAKARQERNKALAEALKSQDQATRQSAMMLLLVIAITEKQLGVEAPREGLVEQGIRALLSGAPYVAQAWALARELKNAGGVHTEITGNATGNQSGVVINTGPSGTGTVAPVDNHSMMDNHSMGQ